jgi:LPS-assembly protein
VTLPGQVENVETANQSGWVTEVAAQLGVNTDVRALWVFDAPTREQEQVNLQLRYRADARRVLSLGYRERGRDISQADGGIVWPLSAQVSMLGRFFYDLEEDRVIEAFGGFQYDSCCWRLRLVGRQFRRPSRGLELTDTETGVFVEVVLKGLAGFDSGLNSILEQGIRGYREQPLNGF